MAIKRGVSFYSYQQADFFDEMDYRDMIRELHDHLKCDGVEIINMNVVRDFPFPSDAWVAEWDNNIARYDMNPVCLDGFLDTMFWRDHVMTYPEAAEVVKHELRLAKRLGFKHIRTMTALPNEVTERCLELSDQLGVKIAWEIHVPLSIKPGKEKMNKYREGGERAVYDTLEWVQKKGIKNVGFVPDFGIFADGPYLGGLEAAIRGITKTDAKLGAELKEQLDNVMATTGRTADFSRIVEEKYADKLDPRIKGRMIGRLCAKPEDLLDILPYVFSFHGKAHNMVEIPGNPGHYWEPATLYKEVFDLLIKNNWDGYVCTEFEGQGAYGDLPKEQFLDEKEQVWRHHQMMIDYGAEA